MATMSQELVRMAKYNDTLKNLNETQVVQLKEIVYDEFEGWDGESVSAAYVLNRMEARYKKYGLTPSRN